jgi:hypothetical protein
MLSTFCMPPLLPLSNFEHTHLFYGYFWTASTNSLNIKKYILELTRRIEFTG